MRDITPDEPLIEEVEETIEVLPKEVITSAKVLEDRSNQGPTRNKTGKPKEREPAEVKIRTNESAEVPIPKATARVQAAIDATNTTLKTQIKLSLQDLLALSPEFVKLIKAATANY